MTETGYVDFKIRPAVEFNVVGSDTGIRKNIELDWKIEDFKPEYMTIDLDFNDPTQVSKQEIDHLEMIIWHGDLFKLETTGESIPNALN